MIWRNSCKGEEMCAVVCAPTGDGGDGFFEIAVTDFWKSFLYVPSLFVSLCCCCFWGGNYLNGESVGLFEFEWRFCGLDLGVIGGKKLFSEFCWVWSWCCGVASIVFDGIWKLFSEFGEVNVFRSWCCIWNFLFSFRNNQFVVEVLQACLCISGNLRGRIEG